MYTLKERIEMQQRALARELEVVATRKKLLAELFAQQLYCDHTFAPPMRGYEHEGGLCIHCGINEVYWAHNKPG